MDSHGYRETYLAALEVAHSDLDQIMEEYRICSSSAKTDRGRLGRAGTFPALGSKASLRDPPARADQRRTRSDEREPELMQPVFHAVPMPEPVIPAAFSPMPEAILDPIQSRINRALGLAVA